MSRYELVIFDLDGTIADTSPGILNCVRYTQKKLCLPEISLEKMYSHVGPPMEESYNKNFGLTGKILKQAVEYHKEYAVTKGYKELVFYDGILQLFQKIKDSNIKIAVATLKAQTTADKIFDFYNLTEKFDLIKGTDSNNPMTKSELLEFCIKKLNVSKDKVVLIGDSQYDAIGAEEENIDFIAVTYGYGFKPNEQYKFNNVGIVNNVTEINGLLKI